MDFLGNSPGTGIDLEDKEKLNAIGLEPSGEVSFQSGIIVNGQSSEIKTVQTVIEDDIIQINRVSTNDISGITIKNTSDGLHANLLNDAGVWKFISGAASENNTTQLTAIECTLVNGVDVDSLRTDFTNHVFDTIIHAPVADTKTSSDSIWSSSKISQELTLNTQASTGELNDFKTNTYDPFVNTTNQSVIILNQTIEALETTTTRELIQDATFSSKILLEPTKITQTAQEMSFVTSAAIALPTYVFQYTSGNGQISNGGLTATLPNTTGNRTVVTENASWFSFGDTRQFKVVIDNFSGAGLILGITKWNIPSQLPALGDIPNQNFVKTADTMFIFSNGLQFNLWDPVLGDLPFPNANGNSVVNGHSVEFKVEADGKVFVNTETNNNVDTLLYTIPNDGAVWKFWLGDNTDLQSTAQITSVAPSGSGEDIVNEKINIGNDVLINSNLIVTGELSAGSFPTLDNHVSNLDLHREIDDNALAPTSLWSSEKINNVITLTNKALNFHIADNAIHAELDDAVVSATSLWSSSKINTELTNNALASTSELNTFKTTQFDPLQSTTTQHIANLGLHREINDATISATELWSSNRTSDYIDEKTAIRGLSSIESETISDADVTQSDYKLREGIAADGDIIYIAGGNLTTGNFPTLWEDVYVKRVDYTKSPPTVETFIFQVELGSDRYFNTIANLQITGRYLVVSVNFVNFKNNYPLGSGNGIHFFDISNKSAGLVYVPNLTVYDVQTKMGLLLGRYLYLLNNNSIKIYDFLKPSPVLIGSVSISPTTQVLGLTADPNYLIVFGIKGYEAFSLELPAFPVSVGTVLYNNLFGVPFSHSFKLIKDGSEIYLGHGTNSQDLYIDAKSVFYKLDVSSSIIAPVVTGQVSTGFAIRSISKCGKYIILGTQRDIRIVDTSTMTSTTPTSLVNTGCFGTSISYNQCYALVDELIYLYPFDHIDVSGLKCCDAVIGSLKSTELTSDTVSIFGSIVVGGACSIGDNALIDGDLLVDGKLQCLDLTADDINAQNLTVSGNLTVNGTQTILNTTEVDVEDVLIKLASNNIGNLNNMGIYGTYNNGIEQRYSGLVRRASDGVYFLVNSSVEPTPTGILSTNDLSAIRVSQLLTNTIVSNDPFTSLIVNPTGNFLEFNPAGFTRLNTSQLIVNNVEQDVRVSAYGQYHYNYPVNAPFQLLANSSWASAFPITLSNANNVLYTPATNTFTIQIAGRYRFSYHISLQNLDDDADFIVASLRANGLANGVFENSSKSRHYRMKNRANSLSATFYSSMNVGDTVRLYLTALDGNNTGTDENIFVYDVNVNLERIFQNV